MGNIHSKSTISVGLHLEVSCYISLAGFIVPISFMGYYHTVTPLYVILWLFVVLAFLPWIVCVLYKGNLYVLSGAVSRVFLYVWGISVILATHVLVCYTGGLRDSFFKWLFVVEFLLTLFIRDKDANSFLRRWRPVLIIGGFEIVTIISILFFPGNPISLQNIVNNSIWAIVLFVYQFLFMIISHLLSEKVHKTRTKE